MNWLLLWFLNYLLFDLNALPQVKLPQGMVDGKLMISESGQKYFGFFGIPYALPPVGALRFKPPVPYLGWNGIFDASRYRDACPQFDASGQLIGSEDCLNLNVFTKSLANSVPTSEQLLSPVMVYIHAESYENGDSSLYGSEKLMDQNIVLVTLNYRLGILGFLSTEDQNSMGNYGLYDQILALKWIRENILFFGGDPSRVTLFGQGAGASSIMYHLMSESSSTLFEKAILQSGSNLCNWAIERKPLEYARRLADKVGCFRAADNSHGQQSKQYPTSIQDKIREILPVKGVFRNRRASSINRMDSEEEEMKTNELPSSNKRTSKETEHTSKEIVDCLRRTSLTKLLKAQAEDKMFGEFPVRAAPTIHKEGLIREEPFQALKTGRFAKKPLIIGLNKDETAYFIPLLVGDNKPALSYDYLERNVVPRFVDATISFGNKSKVKVVSEIMYQYFSNVNWSNTTQILQQFVSMSTDGAYGNCIDETAKLYARSGGLVYFYSYEYRGSNSMLDLLVDLQNEVNVQAKQSLNRMSTAPWFEFDKGVCHGDELFLLISLKTGNLRPYSERDLITQKRLITLWTEFASARFNESLGRFRDHHRMGYPPLNYNSLANPLANQPTNYNPPASHFNFLNPLDQFGGHAMHGTSSRLRKRQAAGLFLGPNAVWPPFNEEGDGQYLVIGDELRVQRNYRKEALDFWKLLFDSELLTMDRSQTEQLDYRSGQRYAAFAYTMLTTTIFLIIVISFLLVVLYWYSKKTRSFRTSIPGICHSNPALY